MDVEPADAVKDSVWWLAWRRHELLMVGVFFGLVAGFFFDALGAGTLVLGVVLVGLGVLSGLFFYFVVASYLGLALVFYLADGQQVLGLFLDPEGELAFHLANSLLRIGAAAGFDVAAEGPTPVEDVGGVLASLAAWSLLGFFSALAVWATVAGYVNTNYQRMLDDFKERVVQRGENLLGSEPFTYLQGVDTTFGVWPAKRYVATNVVVGQSSIMLHHGSELYLPRRRLEVSDSTKQLYYDQVSSVDYDDPFFRVRMSDGEVVSLHTETKPVDLMNLIVQGLQSYKSTADAGDRGGDVIGVVEVGAEPDDEPLDKDDVVEESREKERGVEGEAEPGFEEGMRSPEDGAEGRGDTPEAEATDAGASEAGSSGSGGFGEDILDEVNDILDDFEEAGGDELTGDVFGDVDGDSSEGDTGGGHGGEEGG